MHNLLEFINLPLSYHLVAGFVIRLALTYYGDYHDRHFGEVPYTDIDYKVFTDAARHVLNGDSPYRRHTYRYSPIVAYMMTINILLGKEYGKLLFSLFDILLTVALKVLVEHQLGARNAKIANYCAMVWLYNPMSVGISTRGNADSVPCFLIILSLLYFQTDLVRGLKKYLLSGFLLGLSIHLRLYPLAFIFPMFLSLGDYRALRGATPKQALRALLPNTKQVVFVSSCVLTIVLLTWIMYALYGYEFLFETYIYHLFRRDTRHNFSVLFYHSYLTMDQLYIDVVKTITQIFELLVLISVSLVYGRDPRSLPFALFDIAAVLVMYNSVMTSQYFIWFLSLLPLVVHNFKMHLVKAVVLMILWCSAQAAWLFYAYLLEFKCREIFILVWFKGLVFFGANIFILRQLVKSYTPGYGFGQIDLNNR